MYMHVHVYSTGVYTFCTDCIDIVMYICIYMHVYTCTMSCTCTCIYMYIFVPLALSLVPAQLDCDRE